MGYKHCSVIDADGYYVDFVLIEKTETINGNGEISTEWVVRDYTVQDGQSLVDEMRPHDRAHAGDIGIVRYRWDGTAWVEGATPEEIALWEIDHPAPEAVDTTAADLVTAIEEAMRDEY